MLGSPSETACIREPVVSIDLADKTLLKTGAYVDGRWIDADDGATYRVENPANGELIAEVAECGTAETRRAIEAAEKAMPAWQRKSAKERSALMRRFFDLMMNAQEDLARIMTAEQGKPQSASTATRFPHPTTTSASSSSVSRSASLPASRRGIFRTQCSRARSARRWRQAAR
jgi:hypothetical protein